MFLIQFHFLGEGLNLFFRIGNGIDEILILHAVAFGFAVGIQHITGNLGQFLRHPKQIGKAQLRNHGGTDFKGLILGYQEADCFENIDGVRAFPTKLFVMRRRGFVINGEVVNRVGADDIANDIGV